ncbi:MAG: amidohydrolase family protein [Candidatus Latescibacteria bacterium]|nr:amidohydrolase family protein [Candidatus Latescibacterota bacterium]
MIIDTHVHLYDPMRPKGVSWPEPENQLLYRTNLPVHARAQAVPEGVTGVVVVEATNDLDDNQWILDLAEDDPFIVGLVGRIDPCIEDFARQVSRFAGSPIFQGIRFRGRPFYLEVENSSFLADMEVLADHDLVLDTMFTPEETDGFFTMLDRLPQLRVMIEHIAGVKIDGGKPDAAWHARMQRAAEYPNVYMKVSALMENSTIQPAPVDVDFYAPTIEALRSCFGDDRLVYGSNWPVCERAGTYARCMDIVRTYYENQSEEVRGKFFCGNSKDIYRWGTS